MTIKKKKKSCSAQQNQESCLSEVIKKKNLQKNLENGAQVIHKKIAM